LGQIYTPPWKTEDGLTLKWEPDADTTDTLEPPTADAAIVATDTVDADTVGADTVGADTADAAAAPDTGADAALVATAAMPVLPARTPAPNKPGSGMVIEDGVALTGGDRDDDPSATATPAKPPRRRRRFGGGMFLFVTAIAAIIAITFAVIAVHARSGYFVGFHDDTVVIYKGQRDAVLWFHPTVHTPSTKTRSQLAPEVVTAIEKKPTFPSADAAAEFIQDLVPTTPGDPDTDGTGDSIPTSTTAAPSLTPLSTTTTEPTGG
ncbi:MAG TPA: hypothetical protein PLV68_08695, partial [Ilumatobacteraceae bacterium]|nr:hypothetical protein [Ilumatobacteraceae bacterium]